MVRIERPNTTREFEEMYNIHASEFLAFDQMTKESFLDELQQKNRIYFVAKDNDKIIGYIGLYEYDDDLSIIGIALIKEYQNRGIGTRLLKKAKEVARKMSKKSISLEVDVLNTSAISFYNKNNFVVTNIRKKYYKDNDALVMFCYL